MLRMGAVWLIHGHPVIQQRKKKKPKLSNYPATIPYFDVKERKELKSLLVTDMPRSQAKALCPDHGWAHAGHWPRPPGSCSSDEPPEADSPAPALPPTPHFAAAAQRFPPQSSVILFGVLPHTHLLGREDLGPGSSRSGP